MHEFDSSDEPLPRSTGPRTAEGKAIASQNALKHGCRSELPVLRDEDPVEFKATMQIWFDRYKPADEVAHALAEQVGLKHWFLKRAQTRLHEVEYELPGNAYHWTDDQQNLFHTFQRYHTAAERAFYRAFNEMEKYCRSELRTELLRSQAHAAAAAIEAEVLKIKQVVKVEAVDGTIVATATPSNAHIEKKLSAATQPVIIQRVTHYSDAQWRAVAQTENSPQAP